MRQEKLFSLPPEQVSAFAEKALCWALQEEEYVAYYTSCGISYPYNAFPHMLAIGALEVNLLEMAPFDNLQLQHKKTPSTKIFCTLPTSILLRSSP